MALIRVDALSPSKKSTSGPVTSEKLIRTLRLNFSANTRRKWVHKHRIDSHHFPMLPITLEFGRCVLDERKDLTFFYFDEVVFGAWFQVTLKRRALRCA